MQPDLVTGHPITLRLRPPQMRGVGRAPGGPGPLEVGSRVGAVPMETTWLLETAGEMCAILTPHVLLFRGPPSSGKGIALSKLPLLLSRPAEVKDQGAACNTPHGVSWTGPQGPRQSPSTARVRCSSGTG